MLRRTFLKSAACLGAMSTLAGSRSRAAELGDVHAGRRIEDLHAVVAVVRDEQPAVVHRDAARAVEPARQRQ